MDATGGAHFTPGGVTDFGCVFNSEVDITNVDGSGGTVLTRGTFFLDFVLISLNCGMWVCYKWDRVSERSQRDNFTIDSTEAGEGNMQTTKTILA